MNSHSASIFLVRGVSEIGEIESLYHGYAVFPDNLVAQKASFSMSFHVLYVNLQLEINAGSDIQRSLDDKII